MNHRDAFMSAMRGIPAHHVTQVLNSMVPGANYTGMTRKADIAECYANAFGRWTDSLSLAIRRLDLDVVARRARARMLGKREWRTA